MFLSIFPLLLSIFTSLSKISFVKGWVPGHLFGLTNYKTITGRRTKRFLGAFDDPTVFGWMILAIFAVVYDLLVIPGISPARAAGYWVLSCG